MISAVCEVMLAPARVLAGRRAAKACTTDGEDGDADESPDLVQHKFTAEAPDVAWCGDMTETPATGGEFYLATVIDPHSWRLLGYA